MTNYWPEDYVYDANPDSNKVTIGAKVGDTVDTGPHWTVENAVATGFGTRAGGGTYSFSGVSRNEVRFEVRSGDQCGYVYDSNTKERSEIEHVTHYTQGTVINLSYDMLIEDGTPTLGNWCVCGQYHHTVQTGGWSPPLEIDILGDATRTQTRMKVVLDIAGNGTQGWDKYSTVFTDSSDMIRDQWYHIDISCKFDPSSGFCIIKRDGTTIVNYSGPLGWATMGDVYWKYGIYRSEDTATMAVRYKNMSIGTNKPATGDANSSASASASSYSAPSNTQVVSQNTGACQTMNALFVHLKNNGPVPYFYFELVDNENTPTDYTKHYGLFDYSWNPKPVAYCIKTIMEYLGDAYLCSDFTIDVTGIDTDTQTGEKHLLFKKADGTYAAVVWVEPDIWDENGAVEIIPDAQSGSMTIGATVENCVLVDPFPGRSILSSSVNLGSGNSFNFDIVDHPLIFLFGGRAPGNPPTLKELIGINVKYSTLPSLYTVANIVNGMNYIGLNRIRDNINYAHASALSYYDTLISSGFKLSLYYGYHTDGWLAIADAITRFNHIETLTPGTLELIESGDDIDGTNGQAFTYGGQTGYDAWLLFQADYYSAIKAQPLLSNIKTTAPSVAGASAYTSEGDFTSYADYGDMHVVCNVGQPNWDTLVSTNKWVDIITKIQTNNVLYKPVIVSKFGATNLTTDANGVSQRAAACQLMNSLFVFLKNNGATKMFLYELMDEESGSSNVANHYGLFDFAGNPKIAATCLKTIMTHMSDAYLSNDFSINVSGLDTNALTGEKHLLFKKGSDNTYVAVVLVEPDIWNEGTKADIDATVQNGTLTIGESKHCTLVDPYPSHSTTASSTDKGTGTQFSFSIQDHPLLFKLDNAPPSSGYEAEFDTFVARIPAGSELTTAQKAAFNQFIVDAKADGWWDKLDEINVISGVNATTSRMGLKNQHDLTVVGSPTFTAFRGYRGTGSSSGYLQTDFIPNTAGGNFTLNAAHIGVFVATPPTSGTMLAGATTTQLSANSTGTVGSCVNSAAATAANHITPIEHVVLNRYSSSSVSRWTASVKASTHSATSTSLDTTAWKVGGAGASYSNAEIGLLHYGGVLLEKDIINIRARYIKLMNALGATWQNSLSKTYNSELIVGLLAPQSTYFTTQNGSRTWSYTRDGSHHRFEARDGDTWAGGDSGTFKNRSELLSTTIWTNGNEVWESHAFMLEAGSGRVGGNTLCSQYHMTSGSITSPPHGIYMSYNDTDQTSILCLPDNGITNTNHTLERGRIYRFVSKWKFDPTGNTGYYQVWLDGELIYNKTGIRFGYTDNPNGPYFKFGIYRAWGSEITTTIIAHYWNMEIGIGADFLLDRVANPLPVFGGPASY